MTVEASFRLAPPVPPSTSKPLRAEVQAAPQTPINNARRTPRVSTRTSIINSRFGVIVARGIALSRIQGAPPAAGNHAVRSPADGSDAREIAAISPFYGAPFHVWADGQGGWVMQGETRFDDQVSHTTVWLADATGKVKLAACAAAGGLSPEILQIRQPPAVTPDSVYLAAESFGGSSMTWQLLRIPR